MALKNWFSGGRKTDEEYSIDDLIVLERYDEAEGRLQARLKRNPQDLRSHLKLADVYIQQQRLPKAVDEYVYVAEEYASDGFFDKGIALLAKVYKLVPTDDTLPHRIERIRQRKGLEQVREQALEGLREGMGHSGQTGASLVEVQGLWGQLVRSIVVRGLDGDQLRRLFAAMHLVHFEPGEVLAERNSTEEKLFLLVRGEVEAKAAAAAGGEVQLRTFGAGDVVGEGALLEHLPWPASYVVTTSVTLLELDREGLAKALQGNPDPRRLLDVLRDQHLDREVRGAVEALST
ncbi:MAG: cyclic nucleotide-binding domain-containing protein [Acidobacteria bacterium]|nr:cyclic nucleotide-binding domain-containing protein [Acidobacteriota bacterium]